MKYKVKTEFLPNVIVGQECEVEMTSTGGKMTVIISEDNKTGWNLYIGEDYAKQHPEIFQPIEELKENETEFIRKVIDYHNCTVWFTCSKCLNSSQSIGDNFCSNCGRKKVDK